jgi:hypothetical protein
MRCDECLLSIDEYVCGELEGPDASRVSAHLDACAACAAERATLARERRLFSRCEVSAPPALWASVSRRIEEEATRPALAHAARPWLQSLFAGRTAGRTAGSMAGWMAGWLPRPRVAFAAAVVLLAITSLVLFQTARRGSVVTSEEGVAAVNGGDAVADAPHADGALTPDRPRHDAPRETQGLVAGGRVERKRDAGRAASNVAAVVRRAPRKSAAPKTHHDDAAVPTLAAFEPESDEADARPRAAASSEVIYDETAHHFERAQMLLRSFKNGELSGGEAGFDLTYERRFSRSLLGRNILLRREAQSDGDEETAKLLGRLEPFLLDIANLDERAAPAQVRSIRERMRREGIVARLRLF